MLRNRIPKLLNVVNVKVNGSLILANTFWLKSFERALNII